VIKVWEQPMGANYPNRESAALDGRDDLQPIPCYDRGGTTMRIVRRNVSHKWMSTGADSNTLFVPGVSPRLVRHNNSNLSVHRPTRFRTE
jgi:hypothetical protein